jgi:peptidoglycan/LPS O-acetylase OafA/YrhL
MSEVDRTAPSTAPHHLRHIEGLRGLAVLLVVFFHVDVPLFAGGFVGVDVFFVISGFLITRLLFAEHAQTGTISLTHFYTRRARRLAPALLSTLALTAVLAWLLLPTTPLAEFGRSLVFAVFGVANFYFWNDGDYFALPASSKPLLHTWSLGIEEQFYLLWPLVLALVLRVASHRALVATAALGLVFSAGFALVLPALFFGDGWLPFVDSFNQTRSTMFFLLPSRAYELLIGVCLALAPRSLARSPIVGDVLVVIGLALVGAAVIVFDEGSVYPGLLGFVPCVGAACLIAGGQATRLHTLLTHRTIVWVGAVSYSLYLVHWPLIVLYRAVWGAPGVVARGALVVVAVVVSALSHRFVEVPCRRGPLSRRVVVLLVATHVALVVFGILASRSGGFPGRVAHHGIVTDGERDPARFHRTHFGGAGFPARGPIGDPRPPKLILVGDSHAHHYASGLVTHLGEPHDVAIHVIADTSCLHLPGFTRKTREDDFDTRCRAAVDELVALVARTSPPPVVVLSHAWSTQVGWARQRDDDGTLRSEPVTIDDVITGLSRLKNAIGEAPLVVIGEVPTTGGVNLVDHFQRPWLAAMLGARAEAYETSPERGHPALRDRLAADAAATGAYTFLDPYDVLCRAGRCRNLDDERRLLYSDVAHLSAAGSRFVIGAFADRLLALVQRPTSDQRSSSPPAVR